MCDLWMIINDKKWAMFDGWWSICDYVAIGDRWWMTSDDSWVMADGCSLIVDGWWEMSDYYELTMGGNGFKNGKWLLKVETIEWIR